MYEGWLSHGTGDANKAVDYLLSECDAKGKKRPGVKILRGDPRMVALIANGLDFRKRYSSGYLSFAPEEKLSEEELSAIVDEVPIVAAPGISSDRLVWCAIHHPGPNGEIGDVHYLFAHVELQSGKAFNPAPPAWKDIWTPWREAWNWKLGLARPADQRRQQNVQPLRHEAFQSAERLRGELLEDATTQRERIGAWLAEGVRLGRLPNREAVVNALAQLGQITRTGAEYISVRLRPGARPLRLKGALFDEAFDAVRWNAAERERSGPAGDAGRVVVGAVIGTSGRGGDIDLARARSERLRLARRLEARSADYVNRYGPDADLVEGSADRARASTIEGHQAGAPFVRTPRRGQQPSGPGRREVSTSTPGGDEVRPGPVAIRPEEGEGFSAGGLAATGTADPRRVRGSPHRDGRVDVDTAPDGRAGSAHHKHGRALKAGPAEQKRNTSRPASLVPTVVDQLLFAAEQRVLQLTTTNPKEQPSMTSEQSVVASNTSPRPKSRLAVAMARAMAAGNASSGVGTVTGATGAGADVDIERPPIAGMFAVREGYTGSTSWITRFIDAIRNFLQRLFGIVRQPAASQLLGGDSPDPRDAQIAELKAELSATRAQLGKLHAACAARGFDLTNFDLADDAAGRAITASERALEYDRRRDAARARRELRALQEAESGKRTAQNDLEKALHDVEAAAAAQDELDQADAQLNEQSDFASGLDTSNPQLAAELRARWAEVSRRIRLAHKHGVRSPTQPSEEELQALKTPAQRLEMLQAFEHSKSVARASHEELLQQLGHERREIEARLWPEEDGDTHNDSQRDR